MQRTREELIVEIDRVKAAIGKTRSVKLKRDYGKHLRKLYKEAGAYRRGKEEVTG